jgi:hypothetical protein
MSRHARTNHRVAWLMAKYNLLPPAPLPPSTVQHLPRKERKELVEAAAKAGAKKFHTSAEGKGAMAVGSGSAAAFLTGGVMMVTGGAKGSLGVSLPWARR